MDSSDALYNSQRFRTLTLADNFTRECLAIEAAQTSTGQDAVAVLRPVITEPEARRTHFRLIMSKNSFA